MDVQNKLRWAITEQTAAEFIYAAVESSEAPLPERRAPVAMHDRITRTNVSFSMKTIAYGNVATGLPVARLEGPKGVVFATHFDAESRRVVGAPWDGTARVWDATSPYHRWGSPPIGAEYDTAEGLVPDQRFIALSCRTHGTRVWDTARGELLADLPGVTTVEGDYYSAFPALTATGDRAAITRGNTVEVYALPSSTYPCRIGQTVKGVGGAGRMTWQRSASGTRARGVVAERLQSRRTIVTLV